MKNTKEYNKSYYQKNKEKILARQKAYRDEKREKDLVELTPEELEQQALLKKQKANDAAKKYYESHKEQIKEQQKQYRKKKELSR